MNTAKKSPRPVLLQTVSTRLFIAAAFAILAELSAAGQSVSLDPAFNPIVERNGVVNSLAIRSDGKILISGSFTKVDGSVWKSPARLNPNGSIDATFSTGTDASLAAESLVIQSDGKLILGGFFNLGTAGSTLWRRVARLNTNGSVDTNFFTGAISSGFVRSVALQTDGKVVAGGIFSDTNQNTHPGVVRLNSNGTLDSTFGMMLFGDVNERQVFAVAIQPDGKIIAAGDFTSVQGVSRNGIVRLNSNGSLDSGFNPGSGATNRIFSITVQADGKILVGGGFTSFNGIARNAIARLQTDGTVDSSFVLTRKDLISVNSIVLQTNGMILVSGYATNANGVALPTVGRFTSIGAADNTFNTDAFGGEQPLASPLAVQTDGKLLVGGYFTTVGAVMCNSITRLNSNGSLDPVFASGVTQNGQVNTIAVQTDGRILIGGFFSRVNGLPRNSIARLNSDGSTDNTFTTAGAGPSSVNSITLQSDGKVLIGGGFIAISGSQRSGIARLNSDGSLDSGFSTNATANGGVNSIVLQSDGKIVIGGGFNAVGGVSRSCVARLNGNGTLDMAFNSGVIGGGLFDVFPSVADLAIQGNGRIVIAGRFASVAGVGRTNLARLNSTGTLDTSFNPVADAGDPPWLYSAGPILIQGDSRILVVTSEGLSRVLSDGAVDTTFAELWATVFAIGMQSDGKILAGGGFGDVIGVIRLNTNGTQDLSFDMGIGADNFVTCLRLQNDGKIVIAGRFLTVNGIAKNGIARLYSAPEKPSILTQPQSQTANAGTTVILNVTATGTAPLRYQWRFNAANKAGATNSTLTLANVQSGQAGAYSVIVTNPAGAVTSQVANVTVRVPPSISSQPLNQTVNEGATATFNVSANGTAPLYYQWRFGSANKPGATNATLTLTNVHAGETGSYSVLVSNASGVATSQVASLTVYVRPAISIQPSNRVVGAGATVIFSVTASGTAPLSYQWRLDGGNRAGATNMALAVSNVAPAQAGNYSVVVSNAAGVTNSWLAALSLFGTRRASSNGELTIWGPTSRTYRVEYVNSLSNSQTWTFLTNVSLATNFGVVINPTAPSRIQRFYRSVLLP